MKDFSLQLYSLRDVPELRERLRIAADAGYTGVEFAGYDDISAADMKDLLSSLRLRGTGSHISAEALKSDLEGCIRYCLEAGITSAACPWVDLQTEQDALEAASFLESCAVKFHEAGIPFAYHNHSHEFAAPNGTYLLEILMENTKLLGFELDVFWAAYADVDPAAFIQKHAGRFPLLHFKEIGEEKKNVELGTGRLDFAKLAALGIAQGTKEIIVEQEDYTMPPADSVKADAVYMRALSIEN